MKEIYSIIATKTSIHKGELVENRILFIQTWDSMDKAVKAFFGEVLLENVSELFENDVPKVIMNINVDTGNYLATIDISGDNGDKDQFVLKIVTSEVLS